MENKSDRAFFGQPKGLETLFMTEFWERFSYYGMRAILLYYMYYAVSKGGLGFNQETAASIVAIYGSLVYMTGVLGGYISDRILGSRRTVFWGGVLIMFGHICLSLPLGAPALYISILFITIGTGLLKPNVSEMVGGLYSETDQRRDAGFSIFVMGINLGSMIAPFVVSQFWSWFNFHVGFSLAAIGMFFGLITYYYQGKKYLPKNSLVAPDPLNHAEKISLIKKVFVAIIALIIIALVMFMTKTASLNNVILLLSIFGVILPIAYFIIILSSKKVTKIEKSRVSAYIGLFVAAVIFWAIEEQGSSILGLFVANNTQLNIGGFKLIPSWFQSLNPFFIIIYTPIFALLWTKLGKKQPSSPTKFWLGLIFTGISYLVLVLPLMFGNGGKVSPLWLVLSWGIVEIGEMLISPIGLSVTTKLAPKAFSSEMMSMWFLTDSAGQAINAQLVKFYPGHEMVYFGAIGIVAIFFAILLMIVTPKIKELMAGIN
ncbi:peptide MFS transporter [Bombilactobacillus thymidiniphilus]|uniref:Peptide MFS transporter n=1 Tax=Bombilactobacillus thymidiniphilus TaxID=2923363 RepID=A0ABY4PCI0_9LACO|nr:peptide MFS transporter [Bombilactobacillus thymidiniphilus]UQS83221.1 peptide MFS transporter [Bombilactobacillus thymidiniphilus]